MRASRRPRRRFVRVLVAFIVAGLAACGGSSPSAPQSPPSMQAPPPPPPPPPTATVVKAQFVVTPTGGKTGDPCPVALDNASSDNVLQCTFDAGSSTPNPGITEYRWQFPGVATPVTGVQVTAQHVPCGSFAAFSARDVTLTVVAPQGIDTTSQSVTFEKTKAC